MSSSLRQQWKTALDRRSHNRSRNHRGGFAAELQLMDVGLSPTEVDFLQHEKVPEPEYYEENDETNAGGQESGSGGVETSSSNNSSFTSSENNDKDSNANKPFDSLVLCGCGYAESFLDQVLSDFADWVARRVGKKLTIVGGFICKIGPVPAAAVAGGTKIIKLGTFLRLLFQNSHCSIESLTLEGFNLQWNNSGGILLSSSLSSSRLIPLALQDILTIRRRRQQQRRQENDSMDTDDPVLKDLGLVNCCLDKVTAEKLAEVLDRRRDFSLRTLVVEGCAADSHETISTLVHSLDPPTPQHGQNTNTFANHSSRLEALTLSLQSCSGLQYYQLLAHVLETHAFLKCLSVAAAVETVVSPFRDEARIIELVQKEQLFQKALQRHAHLQLLEGPRLWSKVNEGILQRNYFLWRLEYLCSAQTPTLHAGVWPTLLVRVGSGGGGPCPVYHFLRCHDLSDVQFHNHNSHSCHDNKNIKCRNLSRRGIWRPISWLWR